ncbi:MAG: TIGR04063 family PEP-CTERM/XrtA system glycosyltransferase [Burkholderiales bacterium]
MRILHVLDHSLPLHSGYAFRTAAILREQKALGWQTLQLTTPRHGDGEAEMEEADGWQFHRTPLRRSAWSRIAPVGYLREMAATARRIDRLADAFRPDVLHAHSPVLNALPALWVARRRGLPVVYEVRALWEDAAVDHGTTRAGSARYAASRALETFALRRADRVTTICEGLRSEIAARGISQGRITVIPNAVDTTLFRHASEPDPALARTLGLAGKTVVGFAGSFYGYEGLDLLIDALAVLAPRHPDLRVLLVGGGPQEAALREQVHRLSLGDRVVFAGRVPHAQVRRYYDLIDVLAYPRHRMRLTELVTPLKPLEAMAQGRMLVASDVGGHRELVRSGETGFLFPAGDARALATTIESVLARRADWPRLRDQARRFVESERTWARSAARYADVYESLAPAGRVAVQT